MSEMIQETTTISIFQVPVDGIPRDFRLTQPMTITRGTVLVDIKTVVSYFGVLEKEKDKKIAYPETIELCFSLKNSPESKVKKYWRYANLVEDPKEIF